MKLVSGYPDLLNLYGDYANLAALRRRLDSCALSVDVEALTVGSYTELSSADFVCFGAGTEKSLLAALDDVLRYREDIEGYLASGRKLLATGNSYALFAKGITLSDGTSREGLGFLDADVRFTGKRAYCEYIMRCSLTDKKVVGCVNSSLTLTSRETPFFAVQKRSEKGSAASEGSIKGGLFATELSGPLLVRNPALLDYFAASIVGIELPECSSGWYAYAEKGYENALAELERAIKD